MFKITLNEIRNRFNAAMRMPGKPFDVIGWISRVKGIQHQKRVKILRVAVTNDADEIDTGTIDSAATCNNSADGTQLQHDHHPPDLKWVFDLSLLLRLPELQESSFFSGRLVYA
jgi:hypothetical protein